MLHAWKERLPNMIRDLVKQNFDSPAFTDLMTGLTVVPAQVAVDYKFTDQVEETVETETVEPGYIAFTHSALVEQTVAASFQGLTLVYTPESNLLACSPDSQLPPDCFCFHKLGKIQLRTTNGPVSLGQLCKEFTNPVIEGAFRELALELAKADQLKATSNWIFFLS